VTAMTPSATAASIFFLIAFLPDRASGIEDVRRRPIGALREA
jgi:hypothetical protein